MAKNGKSLSDIAGAAIQEDYEKKNTPEYESYKKKDIEEHKSRFSWPLLDEERFNEREKERSDNAGRGYSGRG